MTLIIQIFVKEQYRMKDNINPNHYKNQCSLECIDTMRVAFGDRYVFIFCCMNAYKYMWRYENKNGDEDLKKADWYLDYAKSLYPSDKILERLKGLKHRIDAKKSVKPVRFSDAEVVDEMLLSEKEVVKKDIKAAKYYYPRPGYRMAYTFCGSEKVPEDLTGIRKLGKYHYIFDRAESDVCDIYGNYESFSCYTDIDDEELVLELLKDYHERVRFRDLKEGDIIAFNGDDYGWGHQKLVISSLKPAKRKTRHDEFTVKFKKLGEDKEMNSVTFDGDFEVFRYAN